MSISYSLAGKRVLITGGAQGIGRTLVQRFHDAGAMVFVIDKDKEAVVKLQNEIPSVIVSIVDLSNWVETRAAVKSFGQIDHLVNNAGIFIPQTFMEVTEGSAMVNFSVHVAAVYNVSQVVAQGMIERGTGGSIISVASIAARAHHASAANYGPVKAAVENLTKSMAVELMPNNIRVNCIVPGLVDTPMTKQDNISEELAEALAAKTNKMLRKRAVLPDEIADLVIFLLSPLSKMITGQGVVIDGGFMAS